MPLYVITKRSDVRNDEKYSMAIFKNRYSLIFSWAVWLAHTFRLTISQTYSDGLSTGLSQPKYTRTHKLFTFTLCICCSREQLDRLGLVVLNVQSLSLDTSSGDDGKKHKVDATLLQYSQRGIQSSLTMGISTWTGSLKYFVSLDPYAGDLSNLHHRQRNDEI